MGYWIIKTEKIVDVDIQLPTECNKCAFSEYGAERYNYCPMCGEAMTEKPHVFVVDRADG